MTYGMRMRDRSAYCQMMREEESGVTTAADLERIVR